MWVQCDGPHCDRDRGWPDDGPYHFDTETAALRYVLGDAGMGWTRRPDGRLLCRHLLGGRRLRLNRASDVRLAPAPVRPRRRVAVCTHCGGAFEERVAEMGERP